MTLTTLDQVWAGLQAPRDFSKVATPTLVAGRPHSLFYLGGTPGAGSAPSAGLKGAAMAAALAGCLPYTNASSGETKLTALEAQMTGAGGEILLCDRLWANSGVVLTSGTNNLVGNPIVSSSVANPTVITCTGNVPFANSDVVYICGHSGGSPGIPDGEYTISNVSGATFTIPINMSSGGSGGSVGIPMAARDDNGAKLGAGVQMALEVSGAMGANTPTCAVVYTNNAGVVNKTAAMLDAAVASAAVGAFHRLSLAAGDSGVRTVQTLTFGGTAWASGTIHLVMYRVLARLPLTAANVPSVKDPLQLGAKMYDGSDLFVVVIPAATTASIISGNAQWAQG
jgi:hypothetical protein